jgi:hypothetical protein
VEFSRLARTLSSARIDGFSGQSTAEVDNQAAIDMWSVVSASLVFVNGRRTSENKNNPWVHSQGGESREEAARVPRILSFLLINEKISFPECL